MHLRRRYLSPALGQFVSLDPLEVFNRYAYVNANPVNRVDPSGLLDPDFYAPKPAPKSASGNATASALRLVGAGATRPATTPVDTSNYAPGGGFQSGVVTQNRTGSTVGSSIVAGMNSGKSMGSGASGQNETMQQTDSNQNQGTGPSNPPGNNVEVPTKTKPTCPSGFVEHFNYMTNEYPFCWDSQGREYTPPEAWQLYNSQASQRSRDQLLDFIAVLSNYTLTTQAVRFALAAQEAQGLTLAPFSNAGNNVRYAVEVLEQRTAVYYQLNRVSSVLGVISFGVSLTDAAVKANAGDYSGAALSLAKGIIAIHPVGALVVIGYELMVESGVLEAELNKFAEVARPAINPFAWAQSVGDQARCVNIGGLPICNIPQ